MYNYQETLCGNAKRRIKRAAQTAAIITSSLTLFNQTVKSEDLSPPNDSSWHSLSEAKEETVELQTGRFIYRSPIKEEKQHLKGAILEAESQVLITSGPLTDSLTNRYWIGVRKGGWLKIDQNHKEIKPGIWSLSNSEPFYSLKVEPIAGAKESVRLFPQENWILPSSTTLKQGAQTWAYIFIEGYLIASEDNQDFIRAPQLQNHPLESSFIPLSENDGTPKSDQADESYQIDPSQGQRVTFYTHESMIDIVELGQIVKDGAVAIINDTNWSVQHPCIIIGQQYRNRPEIFVAAKKLVDHAAAAQTAETGVAVRGEVMISGYDEIQIAGERYKASETRLASAIEMKLYSVNYIENVQYWTSHIGAAKRAELVEAFGEEIGGDIHLFRPDKSLTTYDDPEIEIDQLIQTKEQSSTTLEHYHLDKKVFTEPGELTALLTGANPESIRKENPTFMGISPQTHPHAWLKVVAAINAQQLNEAKTHAWQGLVKSAAAEGFYSDIPVINEILVSIHQHRGSRGAHEMLALFFEKDEPLSKLIRAFEACILQSQGWEQRWVDARRTQEWSYHVPRIGVPEAKREKFRKGLERRWNTEAIYMSRATKQAGTFKRK